MRIFFKASHKNLNCHSPPLFTWMDEDVNTNVCHHFDDEVEERGTLAGNDPNGEF